jgi:dinuclear metal center YbgI/SA1388 family protein
MAQRDEIVRFLAELLSVRDFEDECVNGLQVEGKREVRNIALGVSVSVRLFEAALAQGADMVVVHHGLFWKSDSQPFALRGVMRKRLGLLLGADVSLLAYHLPLDAHPEVGNNAQLLARLGLSRKQAVYVGYLGSLPEPLSLDAFVDRVNTQIGAQAQVFPYGPDHVQQVAVVSGGASPEYHMALGAGADTFLAGDIRENIVRELEEAGINYINAGHYNTERFGIQALGERVRDTFDVGVEFIDVPNPV